MGIVARRVALHARIDQAPRRGRLLHTGEVASSRRRPAASLRGVVAVTLAGVLLSVTACSPLSFRERVCSEGEYPAYSERYPSTGGYCVPTGQEPKRGFARYPPGLVPVYVDQQDACDEDGRCEGGPLAIDCPRNYPERPCTIGDQVLPIPVRGQSR